MGQSPLDAAPQVIKARVEAAEVSHPKKDVLSENASPKGRVLEPWDILRGKCIFKHRTDLDRDLSLSTLRHFAPNCATFSRAREIPIPGVENAPRPIGDEDHPEGIPSEIGKMNAKSKKKLFTHTWQTFRPKNAWRAMRGGTFSLWNTRPGASRFLWRTGRG